MVFAVRGAAKVVWDAVGGCCRYNFGVKSCKSRTVKTAPAAKGMLQISATLTACLPSYSPLGSILIAHFGATAFNGGGRAVGIGN